MQYLLLVTYLTITSCQTTTYYDNSTFFLLNTLVSLTTQETGYILDNWDTTLGGLDIGMWRLKRYSARIMVNLNLEYIIVGDTSVDFLKVKSSGLNRLSIF